MAGVLLLFGNGSAARQMGNVVFPILTWLAFAYLPVLAIGLVLGGITVGEFWRTAATLINALFFSLALALTISSITRQSHVALIGTFGALTLVTVAPLTADWVLSRFWANRHG